ncbi:hypothetical protein [Sanguibacter sp. 26GB23]|uniref:hypothetical protein n=1 Tax=Sanguibacter sp. 26GB23 TaxID=3156066 RepID=UPI0032AFD3B6
MDSPAGIVVLAVVGLWLAYLVPHRLRQRQQMAESRVDDRFSGRLRVLAVAAATAPGPRIGSRAATMAVAHPSHGDCQSSSNSAAPLLTPPLGMTTRPQQQQHQSEGEQDMERPHTPVSQALPVREALHARRAAAARRRALLTAVLLVLSVVAGALAGFSVIRPWIVLAPAVLLGTVLVLGRKAVIGNQKADALWEAREHERRAARPATGHIRVTRPGAVRHPSGRPAAAVRPAVTGHAVHASQSHTQVISRVRSVAGPGTASSDVQVSDADEPATAEPILRAGGDRRSTPRDTPDRRAAGATAESADAPEPAGAASVAASAEDDAEWQPVPVPRPVYTMKSAAPRWEPAPLTAELQQVTEARRAQLAEDHAAPAVSAAPEHEGEPGVDSLGVNLNSVLARRRAAGE